MARRVIGEYAGGRPGPAVVLIGGLHGNEPAGILAIESVLGRLRAERAPLRGRVLGLAGNLGALAQRRRYLARDLNRGWLKEQIRERLAEGAGAAAEDLEERELLRLLVPLLAAASEPIVFLDLHSTSAAGPPFTCMADVLRNRAVAFALRVPLILGIEEMLEGSLLGYLSDLGHVAVGFEGGQNLDPLTVKNHEAAIWSTLVAAGCLAPEAVADLEAQRAHLERAARGLPPVIEIRYRHPVSEQDAFVMEPGYASFSPVARGQLLARANGGEVRAREAGLLLMPRYQGQGDDGFFLARPVSPFWLRASSWLRRLRLDRLVPLLPGISRHPETPDHFVADSGVARFQTVNVFHLFGYRRVRAHGHGLVFSRRRPGFRGVSPLPEELRPLTSREPVRPSAPDPPVPEPSASGSRC